jgi:hypothetical protein
MTTTHSDAKLRKLRRRLGLPVERPTVQKASRPAHSSNPRSRRSGTAEPSRPSDDTLRKAVEDAYLKGREEGFRDARDDMDAIMFRWWQKAALSAGRISKAKLDALTDTMTEKDVCAMNDVLDLLRESGVIDFDGEIYEAREAG